MYNFLQAWGVKIPFLQINLKIWELLIPTLELRITDIIFYNQAG